VRCPSCQTENPEASKFCRECGSRLVAVCTSCGTSLAPGSKFCSECGSQVGAADDEPTRSATASGPTAVGPQSAERRLVSVLFADLVGFTTLAEGRDAEDTRGLLDRYFTAAREVIDRYGGTVEKFIGDAVMAVWGTPTAHEDDAERAVRAALDLVERVRHLGADVDSSELALRAGVLTGEAAVVLNAEGQGMVAGDLVNTAARLQSVADPGTVLVGDATRRATEGAIAYEAAGDQTLKGKRAPVAAHRAVRVVAQRGGVGRRDALDPPFVGREAELRLLKDLFHSTGEEQRPQLVTVLGQAGIGKSRLAWELLKYVDGVTEVAYWHHGRSPAYGDGVAYWALGEMVRSRASISEGEDPESSRAKLAATLADFVPDMAERTRISAALQDLLGLATGDPEHENRPSETIFAAWRTFFERISERGTVVMVFEDLHWADPGLLDFIEHVLDWARGRPILMIALARPELLDRRTEWALARRNLVSLPLAPLHERAMRDLLGGMVPGLPASAVDAIVERAAGVPLYAVETVRMLIGDGRVIEEDGRYRPTGDLGNLAVPDSLHALVAARLDALEAPDRRLLQAASVLGKSFSIGGLAAVVERDASEVEGRLRDLIRREMLAVDAGPRSPERGQYGFVQAVVREVAHSTLARRDRRRLHLAAARHLESLDDPEIAGVLATHYLAAYEAQPEGEEGDAVATQARLALRAAADRAARLGAHRLAQTYLRQALPVARDEADRTDLLEAAALAGINAGATDPGIVEDLRTAVATRTRLGEREAVVAAIGKLGRALLFVGEIEEAQSVLRAAATEYEDLGATAAYVTVVAELTRALMRLGGDVEGVEWADRVLGTAERHGATSDVLEILVNRGTSLTHLSRLQEGAVTLLGAVALAKIKEMPAVEIRAIINLGTVAEADEPRIRLNERGLALIEEYGLRQFLPYLLSNTVSDSLARLEWDRALELTTRHAEAGLTEIERERLSKLVTDIQAFRGELDEEGMRSEYRAWSDVADPQVESALAGSLAVVALVERRFVAAYDHVVAAFELRIHQDLAQVSLAWHAASWLRDRERLVALRPHLAQRQGRMAATHLRALDAGIAALEGRTSDAYEAYREVRQTWQEVGWHFHASLIAIDMLAVLPPSLTELAEVAAEARSALEAAGATPLVAILDSVGAERREPAARSTHPTPAHAAPDAVR
jgi:class 3 adenylate cyclase